MRIRLDKIEDEPFRWSETESVVAESLERADLLELTDVEWSGSVAAAPPPIAASPPPFPDCRRTTTPRKMPSRIKRASKKPYMSRPSFRV